MRYNVVRVVIPLLLIIALALPLVLSNSYYLHLMIMVYVNAILGLGFSMVYSAGLINLGAAGFWAIGAYASALLSMKLGVPFWLSLPLATAIAGLVSFIFGRFIVRYVGAGFVVFTLLISLLFQRVFGYTQSLGGWGGIQNIPRPNPIPLPFGATVAFTGKVPYYYLALTLLIFTAIVFYGLYSSRVGRAWKAIRLNSHLAESIGIDADRYRLAAFVLASAFGGMAGSVYAHYSLTIEPMTFDILKSVHIQIYSILGGLEFYIMGPVIGALLFTLLPELLRVNEDIAPYITGTVVILLVVFLPGGLTGLLIGNTASSDKSVLSKAIRRVPNTGGETQRTAKTSKT
ncbi:MAG: branched-chain amino acid ABC transporter permease [Chloroflexi bacterium]|nr:branched-chain amino acid ABC transporter permease [Chloroflexota bacterium]